MVASVMPFGGAGRLNLRYIPPLMGSNLQKTGTSIFFGCAWIAAKMAMSLVLDMGNWAFTLSETGMQISWQTPI